MPVIMVGDDLFLFSLIPLLSVLFLFLLSNRVLGGLEST